MSKDILHFSDERMDKVRDTYEKWWNKKSEEVVVGGIVKSYAPIGDKPQVPFLTQFNVHRDFTPSQVVDAIVYELSQYEFLGDAYPYFGLDCFGPGVVAAFLGCELTNKNGETSVWFRPREKMDIENIELQYDPDNSVLKRIKAIYHDAMERFEGKVIFSMPDLGGIMDIVSSFFPSEELMYLLYDEPEAVKKLSGRIAELWLHFYKELAVDNMSEKYGYTDWSQILSKKPYYISQCDFSYMIGDDMFKEFIEDDLQYHFNKIERNIYHLDGPGELCHLDTILNMKNIHGIQWVPGSYNPPCEDEKWNFVYDKILDADKLCQIFWSGYEGLYKIATRVEKFNYLQHSSPVFEKSERDAVIAGIKKVKSIK